MDSGFGTGNNRSYRKCSIYMLIRVAFGILPIDRPIPTFPFYYRLQYRTPPASEETFGLPVD
jgi:hypothetical protein